MSSTAITEKEVKEAIKGKLSRYFGVSPTEATEEQMYKAVVMSVRDILLEKRQQFHKKVKAKRAKRVYYLCMEFLLGRSLKNSIYNLSATDVYKKVVSSYGFDLENLYELEPDAGLGNGGLGRLAACFMDALATGNYPAMGYSLRYEYGLFKQKIVDGWQIELPDVWLPGGEVWLTNRSDKSFVVKFDGRVQEKWTKYGMQTEYVNCTEIEATAYDMMISGKDSEAVSVLRLWKAKPAQDFNMKLFSQGEYYQAMSEDNDADLITKVLYPADNHEGGKSLRLKQQYFLCSASIQNIVADHKHRYGDLHDLPKLAAIHLNDTHPAMAIPELMRVLIDENYFSWEDAWAVTTAGWRVLSARGGCISPLRAKNARPSPASTTRSHSRLPPRRAAVRTAAGRRRVPCTPPSPPVSVPKPATGGSAGAAWAVGRAANAPQAGHWPSCLS